MSYIQFSKQKEFITSKNKLVWPTFQTKTKGGFKETKKDRLESTKHVQEI